MNDNHEGLRIITNNTSAIKRIKALVVTDELVFSLFSKTRELRIDSTMPEGAKFVTSWVDPKNMARMIIVEHESFDPVILGQNIPVFADGTVRITMQKNIGTFIQRWRKKITDVRKEKTTQ